MHVLVGVSPKYFKFVSRKKYVQIVYF